MPERKIDLVGPGFKIHSVTGHHPVVIKAEYIGPVACPRCEGTQLKIKDRVERCLHDASMGCSNWPPVCLHLLFAHLFEALEQVWRSLRLHNLPIDRKVQITTFA